MKKIVLIALFISLGINAQTKGNKNIITKNFSIDNVTSIKINLYAKVFIDQNLKEGLSITTDENLFDKIDKEVVSGQLNLDQISWVQPSQDIIIKIGAPNLKRLEQGTHDVTEIILNTDEINLVAPLGNIIAIGEVENLSLGIENGNIDASAAKVENLNLKIWGYGKAKVVAENKIDSDISKEGRLELLNTPKVLKVDTKRAIARTKKLTNEDINWIKFKIQNNSWNRHNFFVVGPKKDGSKFSYGFAMMPNAKRKENWTVGTKIYKVNSIGLRKLLVEIKPEDEGKIVKVF